MNNPDLEITYGESGIKLAVLHEVLHPTNFNPENTRTERTYHYFSNLEDLIAWLRDRERME